MAITEKQADILLYLTEEGITHIEAGNGEYRGCAPFPTLRAMEKRGLVTLSWMREDALYSSPKPYRVARVTDAGRLAAEWLREDA